MIYRVERRLAGQCRKIGRPEWIFLRRVTPGDKNAGRSRVGTLPTPG